MLESAGWYPAPRRSASALPIHSMGPETAAALAARPGPARLWLSADAGDEAAVVLALSELVAAAVAERPPPILSRLERSLGYRRDG